MDDHAGGADAPPGDPGNSRFAANIMHFARLLRAAGLPVGPGKVLDAIRAVEAVGIGSRTDFYWTLHAVFVNRRDQRELFDFSDSMMLIEEAHHLAARTLDEHEAERARPRERARRRWFRRRRDVA